jgi:hypothetical protein
MYMSMRRCDALYTYIYIQRLKKQSTINLTGCWIVTVIRYYTSKIKYKRLKWFVKQHQAWIQLKYCSLDVKPFNQSINKSINAIYTFKPVYKGHSKEPQNVVFMSSCPLYTCLNEMDYSLMGQMRKWGKDDYTGSTTFDCHWKSMESG